MLETKRTAPSGRCLAALLCLALATPPALAAGGPPGAETPEALIARMKAAAAAGDFAEIAACIAPEERAQMAVTMVAVTGMMIGFMQMGGEMAAGMAEGMTEGLTGEEMSAEQKAAMAAEQAEAAAKSAALMERFNAVLADYGLEEKLGEGGPEPPEGMEPGPAARKLLEGVDDVALLRDLFTLLDEVGEDSPQPASEIAGAEITDLVVEGDRATARSGEEAVELVKVDGRWYFKPSLGDG